MHPHVVFGVFFGFVTCSDYGVIGGAYRVAGPAGVCDGAENWTVLSFESAIEV